MKKIVILNGGPRLNGNTQALIQSFTKGAKETGNEVIQFIYKPCIFMDV